jgi:hypothetical protein
MSFQPLCIFQSRAGVSYGTNCHEKEKEYTRILVTINGSANDITCIQYEYFVNCNLFSSGAIHTGRCKSLNTNIDCRYRDSTLLGSVQNYLDTLDSCSKRSIDETYNSPGTTLSDRLLTAFEAGIAMNLSYTALIQDPNVQDRFPYFASFGQFPNGLRVDFNGATVDKSNLTYVNYLWNVVVSTYSIDITTLWAVQAVNFFNIFADIYKWCGHWRHHREHEHLENVDTEEKLEDEDREQIVKILATDQCHDGSCDHHHRRGDHHGKPCGCDDENFAVYYAMLVAGQYQKYVADKIRCELLAIDEKVGSLTQIVNKALTTIVQTTNNGIQQIYSTLNTVIARLESAGCEVVENVIRDTKGVLSKQIKDITDHLWSGIRHELECVKDELRDLEERVKKLEHKRRDEDVERIKKDVNDLRILLKDVVALMQQ